MFSFFSWTRPICTKIKCLVYTKANTHLEEFSLIYLAPANAPSISNVVKTFFYLIAAVCQAEN